MANNVKKSSEFQNAPSTQTVQTNASSPKTGTKSKTPQPKPIAPAKTSASKIVMGKFCIKQSKDGSYMFNLKAGNGEIVATSDMYSSIEKCKKGIASVQLNAPIANLEDHTVSGAIEEMVNPKFELYHDKSGEFRFRLKAKNGSIIAKSQGYSTKTKCLNGIESVRKNAMSDIIVNEDAAADTASAPEVSEASSSIKVVVLEESIPMANVTVKESTPEAKAPAKESTSAPKKAVKESASTPKTAAKGSVPATTTQLGKFVIKQAKDGSFMFNLKASNGEIVATSDMYSTLEKCRKGIASVQANAPIANLEDSTISGAVEAQPNPKFELYQDKSGEFRFRLKARNGLIIAKSQGYSSKTRCKNGIDSVRKNAKSEEVITEKPENNP